MSIIDASVIDDSHLKLLTPIKLSPGTKIKVIINTPEDIYDEEHKDWTQLSISAISNCYGDDEPDYNPDMVKEPTTSK